MLRQKLWTGATHRESQHSYCQGDPVEHGDPMAHGDPVRQYRTQYVHGLVHVTCRVLCWHAFFTVEVMSTTALPIPGDYIITGMLSPLSR